MDFAFFWSIARIITDVFSVMLEHLETALDYGNMVAASFFPARCRDTAYLF